MYWILHGWNVFAWGYARFQEFPFNFVQIIRWCLCHSTVQIHSNHVKSHIQFCTLRLNLHTYCTNWRTFLENEHTPDNSKHAQPHWTDICRNFHHYIWHFIKNQALQVWTEHFCGQDSIYRKRQSILFLSSQSTKSSHQNLFINSM